MLSVFSSEASVGGETVVQFGIVSVGQFLRARGISPFPFNLVVRG